MIYFFNCFDNYPLALQFYSLSKIDRRVGIELGRNHAGRLGGWEKNIGRIIGTSSGLEVGNDVVAPVSIIIIIINLNRLI